MTTTTAEYWSVIPEDGIEYPLQTLAKNIITWGDSRQGVVPMRGDDVKIPWLPGEQEVNRVPDVRTIGLQMWVLGYDDNGAVTGTPRQQFNRNWRILQRICWNKGKILLLKKRFYDESGTLQTAVARARYADGLEPSMMGLTGAKFTVDFKLADPYFYSAPVSFNFNTATATNYNQTIIGQEDARKISVVATADASNGVENPKIQIIGATPPRIFQLTKSISPGDALTFQMDTQYALDGPDVVSNLITHSGNDYWMDFPTGAQTINIDRSDGDWAGTITYTPAWL